MSANVYISMWSGILPRIAYILTNSTCRTFRTIHRNNQKCNIMNRQRFSSTVPRLNKEKVTLHFVSQNGERMDAKAKVGDSFLDVIHENNIDIDGFGACEGTLACSTCHLIFKEEDFNKIEEPPTDEELDMLDLAFDLCDTSRLGCQVIVSKDMDGWEISVPTTAMDARS